MLRSGVFCLAILLAPWVHAAELRGRTPEQAREAARNFESAPPGREAESVRLPDQNLDEFYPTPNAGDMPTHNELVRYMRSAHANAAEIQEAIEVSGVMFVDVTPLFEAEDGKGLERVLFEHNERIPALREQLLQNPVTARAMADNRVDVSDVVAVQLEATGLMTVYVRSG